MAWRGPPPPRFDGPSADLTAMDRSQRSVFVGNIAYEATESELVEMFGKVGPVVHFRLVFDRDTGKPKGYGFCEYADVDAANSAIRNLAGIEVHGRPLRVDSAAGSERNKEEMRQLQMTLGAAEEESPYGASTEPSKAPEAISRAVASLPPEQMFELMKQMKLCIQNNPNEARNMLMQNPQLAYALLQAQVVMRIVEPQAAMQMLHAPTDPQAAIMPSAAQGSANLPSPNHPQQAPLRPKIPVPGGGGGGGGGGLLPPPRLPPPQPPPIPPPAQQPQRGPGDIDLRQGFAGIGGGPSATSDETEKAQLIVKVLQLTEEQINMLQPDQKRSVLMLREQLRNSAAQQ